jgi:hypothetical protein
LVPRQSDRHPKGLLAVSKLRIATVVALAAVALAGCQRNPLIVRRALCPAVAVPIYAGDITLFQPGTGPDAGNIDLSATITNVRDTCTESPALLATNITYQVVARRSATIGARRVSLPVFAAVVQGGNLIVSKQIGSVDLDFADGQARAVAGASARGSVARSATTLPADIQAKINRKRKAGDIDAATDPMSDPLIRAALRAASFEVLVGFQLTDQALGYNVTK